jgi:hypothetical protein
MHALSFSVAETVQRRMDVNASKLIILGQTTDGQKFRPSDWAERLSGSVARHGPGRRIIYHPSVKVVMRNGIKCVSVDRLLEEESPQLYQFILNFANENHLKIEEAR